MENVNDNGCQGVPVSANIERGWGKELHDMKQNEVPSTGLNIFM